MEKATEAVDTVINIGPTKVESPWLDATFVVKIVRVKGRDVTISVGGKEYDLRQGDTFNFVVKVA